MYAINITASLDLERYTALAKLRAYGGSHYEDGWLTYRVELHDVEVADEWVAEHATAGFSLSRRDEKRLKEMEKEDDDGNLA
jgi:hypothetical protein